MSKYRKKPVVIEASQWNHLGDHPAVTALPSNHPAWNYPERAEKLGWLHTLEGGSDGAQVVHPSDWIITGVQGEHYPIKADIFAATYESVESLKERSGKDRRNPANVTLRSRLLSNEPEERIGPVDRRKSVSDARRGRLVDCLINWHQSAPSDKRRAAELFATYIESLFSPRPAESQQDWHAVAKDAWDHIPDGIQRNRILLKILELESEKGSQKP